MTEDDEPTFLSLTAEQAERAAEVLRLSPRLRTFVRMGCVEGASLDEIAAALELTAEQVVGLRDDLEHDLEATTEGAGESWARMLLAVFRTGTPRDHGPMVAANRFSGVIEEVTVRSPLLNEDDLGDRFCRTCRHWEGPPWPSPHPGVCMRGVSQFENPDGLTLEDTFVYVRNGKVCGCAGVTRAGFTCPFWKAPENDEWRTEPIDVLGRAPGQAGRWRQKAPGRKARR